MKFGVQLFGVLRDRKTDTLAALREVAGLGYAMAEPCISTDPIPGMEHVIWPLEWFEAHCAEIRALGLEIPSAHIFSRNLSADREKLVHLTRDFGIRQLVVKSPQVLSDESLQQASMTFMQIADALSEVGGELLIHNEGADIEAKFGGKTAYEHLLGLCLGKVGAQVDVGWVYVSGEDPVPLLHRLGSLVKSLHYKDFTAVHELKSQVAVGHGNVDTAACFQFARAAGIPHIVDQDAFFAETNGELRRCIESLGRLGQTRGGSVSYLNTLDVETGEVKTLARFDKVIEAPNWLKGEDAILFNSEGRIWRYDIASGEARMIESGECDNCNNDHVVSPDEKSIAVSHGARSEGFASRVYVFPIGGGEPRLVTPNSPSFLHGWSPDGREFAYCAFRMHEEKMEVDVYAIPAEGGDEVRLTSGGFNDGPEYSPDGKHIWFNSTRTGLMQIWRMERDGSHQTQMTFTERNNWFAHISPDGKRVVYLSYRKGDLEAREHLPNMQVELWMMNADGTEPRRVLSLFGGQGSINVNSWAGDSRHIAFVSYELKHE